MFLFIQPFSYTLQALQFFFLLSCHSFFCFHFLVFSSSFIRLVAGVSQFGFIDSVWGAALLVTALLVASRRLMVAGFLGSLIGFIMSWWVLLVARRDLIIEGVYGTYPRLRLDSLTKK